jgi:hypothetical protein
LVQNKHSLKRFLTHPLISGTLIGLGGALILFRSLFGASSQWVLWSGTGDSRLIYWIVSWGYHILIERRDPANFWNANQFYPNPLSLAYSDSMLSLQALFAPLRLLGVSPLPALYIGLALTLIISCALTFLALQRIGGMNWLEMALITFAANLCLPMVTMYYHFQLFGFNLAIPYFLFLFLYLRDLYTFDLTALCLLYAAATAYATYLGPILLVVSIILTVPFLLRLFFRGELLRRLRGGLWKQILIIAAIATVLYYVQLRPYALLARFIQPPSPEEASLYSANLNSIIVGLPDHSLWYQPKIRSFGSHEYANFAGLSLLVPGAVCLGLLASIFSQTIWQARHHAAETGQPGSRSNMVAAWNINAQRLFGGFDSRLILFMALLFIVVLVLSWGPFLKWNDIINSNIHLPYYVFMKIIPGLERVRAPGRIGIFFGLPLGIFLVLILRYLLPNPDSRRSILALFFLLVIIEALPVYATVPFDPDPTGIYKRLGGSKGAESIAGEAIIELPVASQDTLEPILEQLVGSTFHWGHLVIGYGQRFAPEHKKLLALDSRLQNGQPDIQPLVNFARRNQVPYMLIHLDRYTGPIQVAWNKYGHSRKVCVLYEEQGLLFLGLETRVCKR